MVSFGTGDGYNYNHDNVRNQLEMFGLFLLGNTDKVNITGSYPRLSFVLILQRDQCHYSVVDVGR